MFCQKLRWSGAKMDFQNLRSPDYLPDYLPPSHLKEILVVLLLFLLSYFLSSGGLYLLGKVNDMDAS
ncbi:hypothetical protein Fmac_027227 [Flemingia macrophylla]|uniref:Uncharacterized protein n=1 Tax=Flemingia macrophylla TaxID=520843 RepID=A0ABD1LHL7_9FABA